MKIWHKNNRVILYQYSNFKVLDLYLRLYYQKFNVNLLWLYYNKKLLKQQESLFL